MYDALSIPNFNDAFNAGTCELDQLFIVQPAINDGFKNQVLQHNSHRRTGYNLISKIIFWKLTEKNSIAIFFCFCFFLSILILRQLSKYSKRILKNKSIIYCWMIPQCDVIKMAYVDQMIDKRDKERERIENCIHTRS